MFEMTSLTNGLGGSAGFGESFLNRNDDGSTGLIDLRPVFGNTGLNFFGTVYTALYVNNNGSVSFASPIGQYTPTAITGVTSNPQIAAFWAALIMVPLALMAGVVTSRPLSRIALLVGGGVALVLLARQVLLLLPLSRMVTVPLAPAGLAIGPLMAPVLIVKASLFS
jgi:hypothetical protein